MNTTERTKLEALHRQLMQEERLERRQSEKRRRKLNAVSTLRALELEEINGASPPQLKRLQRQGIRPAVLGPRFPPGSVVSVQLVKCAHRARVEALSSGYVPARAKCPRCGRWRGTLPLTARKPIRAATRVVVDERSELRDGRTYSVQVLKTPRRARF